MDKRRGHVHVHQLQTLTFYYLRLIGLAEKERDLRYLPFDGSHSNKVSAQPEMSQSHARNQKLHPGHPCVTGAQVPESSSVSQAPKPGTESEAE